MDFPGFIFFMVMRHISAVRREGVKFLFTWFISVPGRPGFLHRFLSQHSDEGIYPGECIAAAARDCVL